MSTRRRDARLLRVWTVCGRITKRPLGLKQNDCYDVRLLREILARVSWSRDSCERSNSLSVCRLRGQGLFTQSSAGQGVRRAAVVVTPGVSYRTTAF